MVLVKNIQFGYKGRQWSHSSVSQDLAFSSLILALSKTQMVGCTAYFEVDFQHLNTDITVTQLNCPPEIPYAR